MPCFRGVELSLVAATTVLPEFPHPDGSSARFLSTKAGKHRSAIFLSPKPWGKIQASLADDTQKADPKTSVYVPSIPDANFFVRYSITQAPIGHKYLFFKVSMNGRHTVSWGINVTKTTSGATHQALFEPSGRYHYDDDGVAVNEPGIEARIFRFVSSTAAQKSVADDGGLIEVQVFRAKARNRRAPRPDQYRGGNKYGIALVSNGLLDKPHTATYYDYHLADAKDSPYATFCFHYRSWENLKLLQLTRPESPSSEGSTATPVTVRHLNLGSKKDTGAGLEDTRFTDATDSTEPPGGIARRTVHRPLPEPPRRQVQAENTADDEQDSTSAGCQSEDISENINTEEFHGRRQRNVSGASKVSMVSATSAASKVSVTPSLQQYVDGTDGLQVDTMEFGLATKLEAVFCGKLSERNPLVNTEEENLTSEQGLQGSGDAFYPAMNDTHYEEEELEEGDLASNNHGKANELLMFPFTDSLHKRDMAFNAWPQVDRRSSFADMSPRSRGSPQPRRAPGGSLDSFPQLTPRVLGRGAVGVSRGKSISPDSRSGKYGGKSRETRSSSRAHWRQNTALRVEEWAKECAKEAGIR